MRFVLFDRITHLDKGRSVRGETAFGRSSTLVVGEHRSPMVPTSILIESMVQLLGWAVIHSHDFRLAAIVCLVEGVTVNPPGPAAGSVAEIGGEILAGGRNDSLGRAWLDINGTRKATIERVIYRHFHDVDAAALEAEFQVRSGRPISTKENSRAAAEYEEETACDS